jgi:hypothetical protein
MFPVANEPGTGEINSRDIFRHSHGRGYTGVIGMEHNASNRGTKEGERAVNEAYIAADDVQPAWLPVRPARGSAAASPATTPDTIRPSKT